MKVETNHQTDFKPIELKITIESKQELALLLGATNASDETLYANFPQYVKEPNEGSLYRLYVELKKLYQSC